MYRVMLVDDEMLARVGVKSLIPWNEHGFELVGEFENGQKALEAVKELLPDIIITDVKMPVLNGIDFIRCLKDQGMEEVKVIVLSSYDDFGYVKEAMKIGVEDYLLKLEMEPEKLLEVLKKTTDKITREAREKNKLARMTKFVDRGLDVLRERFLKDIIEGKLKDMAELQEGMDSLNIPLQEKDLLCILLQIDSHGLSERSKDDGLLENSVVNFVKDMMSGYGTGEIVKLRDWSFALLLSLKMPEQSHPSSYLEGVRRRFIRNLVGLLKDSLNIHADIGSSSVFQSYGKLHQSYEEAQADILAANRTEDASHAIPLEDKLKELEIALKELNPEAVSASFEEIYQRVRCYGAASKKKLNGILHVIIFILNNFAKEQNISQEHLWGIGVNPYLEVDKLESSVECAAWIKELQGKTASYLNTDHDTKTMIIKAKQFIRKRFKDDISLEAVAEHLGLSANYFSRIFSRETGTSFIDYLIDVRITMAKELLKNTNSKVYEVSEQVGYENAHYFSRIFKKVTGLTPQEYKSCDTGSRV